MKGLFDYPSARFDILQTSAQTPVLSKECVGWADVIIKTTQNRYEVCDDSLSSVKRRESKLR